MKDLNDSQFKDLQIRALIENAPEPVFIFDIDSGKFIDFNQKALDFFKKPKEEMFNLGPLDLSPETINGRKAALSAQSFLLAAIKGSNPVFDWVHKNGEGEEIPCEIRLTRFPPYDRQLVRASIIDNFEKQKTKQALKKIDLRLKEAQSIAKIGSFDYDLSTKKGWWSDFMFELFGINPKETTPDQSLFLNRIHPEDKDKVYEKTKTCIKQCIEQRVEYRLKFPDGRIKYIDEVIRPVKNRQGVVTHLYGTSQDTTDRKITENALQESEERYNLIFDQQFQFMVILDPEGRILMINDLPLRITQKNREEFVGKYFWKSPAWEGLPEFQKVIKNHVFKCLTLPHPLSMQEKFITADNEIRYADSVYSAIRDSDNQVRYILVQGTDVTEKKVAEEILVNTQKDLADLMNRFKISTKAAKVGIWEWDPDDEALYWDDTMYVLYGLDNLSLVKNLKAWFDLIHPEDEQIFRKEINLALNNGTSINTEFRVRWPDKSIHYIKAVATIQRKSKDQPLRMIGTNWDITKDKEAERQKLKARQLELRNKELEHFAYAASHDLQEPLRTIKSFVKLLEKDLQTKNAQKTTEYLDFIDNAAERMSQLIRSLLNYSRIGRVNDIQKVNLNNLVLSVLKDLGPLIKETETIVEIGDLPLIHGYKTELKVLFHNLISNGIKFRKKNISPLISISSYQTDDGWGFSIKDNGIGIDPEFNETIFVIFQRLHGRDEYPGTGIGLALCRKIVELHGGKIWLESTPEKGSTFCFTLLK